MPEARWRLAWPPLTSQLQDTYQGADENELRACENQGADENELRTGSGSLESTPAVLSTSPTHWKSVPPLQSFTALVMSSVAVTKESATLRIRRTKSARSTEAKIQGRGALYVATSRPHGVDILPPQSDTADEIAFDALANDAATSSMSVIHFVSVFTLQSAMALAMAVEAAPSPVTAVEMSRAQETGISTTTALTVRPLAHARPTARSSHMPCRGESTG